MCHKFKPQKRFCYIAEILNYIKDFSNYEMCYSIRTMNFRTVMYDAVPDWYDTYNIKNILPQALANVV